MATRKQDVLFVALARKVGLRDAYKVLLFIICWGTVYEATDGPVESIEEYAGWWNQNERSAYREQELFRKAFEHDANPNRVWEQLRAKNPNRDKFHAAVKQVTAAMDAKARHKRLKLQETAAMIGTLQIAL